MDHWVVQSHPREVKLSTWRASIGPKLVGPMGCDFTYAEVHGLSKESCRATAEFICKAVNRQFDIGAESPKP